MTQDDTVSLAAVTRVLRSATVGVLVVARGQPELLFVNRALEKLLGYEPNELTGQPLENLVPPTPRTRHADWLAQYFADPHERAMGAGQPLFALHRDGHEVPVEIALAPQLIDGRTCVIAYVSDRTHAVRMQRRLEDLLAALPQGVLVVDSHGVIRQTTPALDDQFGYPRGELIGQPLERLLPQRLLAVHRGHFEGYKLNPLQRRMGMGRDLTALHRTGVEFPVEVALSAVDADDGLHFVAVVSDITSRKRSEDALRQTNAQLEEFTYVASHDLRSPLRGIADLLSWIREDLPPEQITPSVQQNFDRAALRIARCERMIDDLLDYARAGTRDTLVALLDPRTLAEEAAHAANVPAGFAVDLDVTSQPFMGHATPLAACLRNLIGNAAKHHGSDSGRIRVTARDEGRFAVFAVEDDGPGVPEGPRETERIFKLFHRANAEAPGHGIGLAVTRRMVNAHGGTIVVERSLALGGACFRVHWPRILMKESEDE